MFGGENCKRNLSLYMLLSQNWKIHFFGAYTTPSKTFEVLWKPLKNIVKKIYKNHQKNIVPKVGISIILRKPLKQRLLNLLTFKKSLFRRLGFLQSFEHLRVEGYDLRPGLLGIHRWWAGHERHLVRRELLLGVTLGRVSPSKYFQHCVDTLLLEC